MQAADRESFVSLGIFFGKSFCRSFVRRRSRSSMSSPPVELSLLCAVAQNLNSTPDESDRRVERRKKTFGKERRSSENIGQRTSAVCYCAIFGTAALPDAHSSLLSNVGLVFSLLLSLNKGRPTFRPEDSFTIDKNIFFS